MADGQQLQTNEGRIIAEIDKTTYLDIMMRHWKQGEHVVIIGQTGTGKTTLARDLLQARTYIVAIAVKLHDDTLNTFLPAYKVITKWPPDYGNRRLILWVKPQSLIDDGQQRTKILLALQNIYLAGGWCVYFDDLSYITDQLRIKTPIVTFFNQGRSSGLSNVASVTRPRKVPLEAFTQVRHVVMFHYSDTNEVERVAEIAGIDRKLMLQLNQRLQGHDFLAFSHGDIAIVRQ